MTEQVAVKGQQPAEEKKEKTKKEMTRFQWIWHEMKRQKVGYYMVIPFLIMFICFTVIPVLLSILLSFTSFNMLQKFSFDILKIDMSFTREIEANSRTRKLIPLIIEAAHALDARTVAEGAETKEQVEFLKEHGCDYIQGYYSYKPMPENEFVTALEKK